MSESMTNGEIEDVLSSIRRLVGDGKPPSGDSNGGALLLTPALRVPDVAESHAEKRTDEASLEDSLSMLEAEVFGTAQRWKDGVSDPLDLGNLAAWTEEAAQSAPHEADAWEPADGDTPRSFAAATGDVEDAEVTGEDVPAGAEVLKFRHRGSEGGDGAARAPAEGEGENVAKPDIESLLDEDDLRALVAEVLREELKGPLGERITRNVRKLVRREIAQALSALELD